MKANYVLVQDGLCYYVMKRKFTKLEYQRWENFISFHSTIESAYDKAILLSKNRIIQEKSRILNLHKLKKNKRIYA
jgi:hypothetical protein